MNAVRQKQKSQPDKKSVGIWLRVSTEDQVRGESPETHERRARLYAEAKGWHVAEVYRLDAVSGKTVKETPEAKQMIDDIRQGHITGLIFSKLARLARNTKELLEFSESFRECGADLISLAESIDTSTPAGRLFYTMIAAMAQWEREEIADRVAAAVPIRAKAGKPTGGQAPFGYAWKDQVLVLDALEAPVRKLIFELFREHKRKKLVARLLNEQGYRTRNGGPFTDTTVDRLLRDPIAKGTRRANYTRSPNGDSRAWALKPEEEWVLLDAPAIVSEDLWAECNHYLDGQRTKLRKVAKTAVHLFAGVTYCTCGKKMYVPSNSPKYTCKPCRNKIPVDDLEAVFHEQIKHFLFSDTEIATRLDEAHAVLQQKSELLAVLQNDAGKLAEETDKLYDLYQSGMIDKVGFGEKYRPLSERRSALDDQIPTLQAEIDILKIAHLSEETALEDARDLHSRWPSLPQEEKQRIVEAITERITIGDGEIDIHLYYTPPPITEPEPPDPGSGGGPPLRNPTRNRGTKATNSQRRVAFLPNVPVHLNALIPKRYDFEPKTLGEHLKKQRLERGLLQTQVATLLGVDEASIVNWERGKRTPQIRHLPAIYKFLGYYPINPGTQPHELKVWRLSQGISIKRAAKQYGVDERTWAGWEEGVPVKFERHRELLRHLRS